MSRQTIYQGYDSHKKIQEILAANHAAKVLLVCGGSFDRNMLKPYVDSLDIEIVRFGGFSPNPKYDEIVEGVKAFRENHCDFIMSVGGGSAMDVAKCIRLFAQMPDTEVYLKQEFTDNGICHLAIPTTAGTGSESTRFAVCYYQGEKQSVAHDSILPEYVVLEPALLETLPIYQKKVTLLDALGQAIESIWSVNATEESQRLGEESIGYILGNYRGYLDGNQEATAALSTGANLSGQAINITQTTAAHAMSYKLTSMYGLPHGHAVAVCLGEVWNYLNDRYTQQPDAYPHLKEAMEILCRAFHVDRVPEAIEIYRGMLREMEIGFHKEITAEDMDKLVSSVNPVRLKNMPVIPTEEEIRGFYTAISCWR